ncbi:molybdate ABC transporter substrate-binding protein [Veillonella sp.]|uniref:molybdate ABC transporter substrate-binding protein n=1 Tax=Veillonella sp. TaxID=1926307 RepID=UPI0025FB97EB|nr:molybdate ABC transporter substrate-binding protein [Veillonella sp.]
MKFKSMYKVLTIAVLGAALLVAAGCGSSTQTGGNTIDKSQKITVSAAASLQAAMTELKTNFIKEHNMDESQIAINFGGSGTLRQQIESGAPASIFVSADEKNMKMLQDKQLVDNVKPLTANSLVLIMQKDKTPVKIDQLGSVNRLAIGTVETVPAGKYAKETLTALNLWNQVEPNIVYAKDVKAVAAYVAEGSAEAGFVYKTDALDLKEKVQITDTAPANSHTPILYPIGIVTKYDSPLAQEFYKYLTSEEAQKVLEKYGFAPVSEATQAK